VREVPLEERELKLEARLIAIEQTIADLYKMIYALCGLTDEHVALKHEKFRAYLKTLTIPGVDPVQSDAAASEIEAAFEHLLGVIEDAREAGKTGK
jgi:hypothetical protein